MFCQEFWFIPVGDRVQTDYKGIKGRGHESKHVVKFCAIYDTQ